MELKLKFWDNEREIMIESPQAVLTAFRNYSDIADFTSFSDCNNQPNPKKYEPLLLIGKDKNGIELYTTDVVKVELSAITEDLTTKPIFGTISYDKNECCFCVKVSNGSKFEMLPLFGIMSVVEKIGNGYDKPHPLSFSSTEP